MSLKVELIPPGQIESSYMVPPEWSQIVPQIATLLSNACHSSSPIEYCEIEGRIGTFQSDNQQRGSTSIDRSWFEKKLQYLSAPGSKWDRIDEETTTAYLFNNHVRAVQKSDNQAPVFVCKKRRCYLDLSLGDQPLQIRFSHSLEIPMETPCDTPHWVRLRKRKSFYATPFRYDFSYILEAKKYSDAKQQPMHFEIEIEFLPHELHAAVNRGENVDFTFYALAFLMRMQDLVTENGHDAAQNPLLPTLIQQPKKLTAEK